MKRRKPILLLAAALLLIVPLTLFLRKPAPLDLSKDEEPFKSVVLPPKLVRAGYYMDGGSVAVQVSPLIAFSHKSSRVTLPAFEITAGSHSSG